MKFGLIWKSDWFIGTTLTLLFVLAFQQEFTPLKNLENTMYDTSIAHTTGSSAGQPNQTQSSKYNIVIINIDAASRRPSGLNHQSAIASAIQLLTEANAQFIGVDAKFTPPKASDSHPSNTPLTDTLATTIRHSGNTLLPIYFDFNTDQKNTTIASAQLKNLSLKHVNENNNDKQPTATLTSHPYTQLMLAAAGIGHISNSRDSDGIIRSEILSVAYGNHHFPSLTLIMVANILNVSLDDIRINIGQDIEIGPLNVTIDAQNRMYPSFFQAGSPLSFQRYSFQQLHEGTLPASTFTNKIILIGDASSQLGNTFPAPNNDHMTRIEFSAHVIHSLLYHHMFEHPAWTQAITLALFFIIGLYLITLLPRLNNRTAIMSSTFIFLTLISSEWILLTQHSLWLQMVSAATLLLIGHLFISCKQALITSRPHKRPNKKRHETNKILGISFQDQGMLDQAFQKFIACPMDNDILSHCYELASAYERKRQFKQAIAAYEYIANHKPNYKDIQARMATVKSSEQSVAGEASKTALSTLLLSTGNTSTLGRYEIISELGRGAMGTVYLGKDPKINRQVAIKTMALSLEFEPDELEDAKAKFFHEAEIAGMLNHPNIVTIFDAGDEHDLAYIAMEFLDGIDLSPYTKKGKLLPFSTTLKIAAKVTGALQYAHDHDVIHRDIKPANIMILKNKSVKVTDFGIAHIIDCSKNKAGVVLGTPSYMSPEQLSGKKLDGRSDLFSLGVMLYELVSGTRPFRAESISKLMYKIAKQPHVDVREHNADVPDCIRKLIDELLAKKADQRISTANDVLAKISSCLRELKNNGEKP